MKILKEGKRDIKILIEDYDEIDEAYKIGERKFKFFNMLWDYNFFDKTGKDLLIIRKTRRRKCEICGKLDVCDLEHDDGGKIYKICAVCWNKLNS